MKENRICIKNVCTVQTITSDLFRVTCESIEKYLRGKGRKMWAERVAKVAIVLVDVATTSSDLADSDGSGLPLLQLRDAIHKVRHGKFSVH